MTTNNQSAPAKSEKKTLTPEEQAKRDEAKALAEKKKAEKAAADQEKADRKREHDRAASQAEADELAAEQRKKLEAKNAKLDEQIKEMETRLEAIRQAQNEVLNRIDRGKETGPTRTIVSRAFNPTKALERVADIWPDGDGHRPVPLSVKARTYDVRPVGKNSSNLPTLRITNCADEGQAKAEYYKAVGGHYHVAVKAELVTVEEYQSPDETADPASAAE